VDAPQPGELFLLRPDGVSRVLASATVLATGSRELFLPFPGWTLPGVAGAGGYQALAKGGMPVHGRRVVVAGTGPLLIAVAATLRAKGATIAAVVEQAPLRRVVPFAARLAAHPAKLRQALGYGLRLAAVPKLFGCWPVQADGDESLRRVRIAGARERWIDCDALACGFGLVPNVEAGLLLGCELAGEGLGVDAMQRTGVEGVFAAGEVTGIGGVDVSLAEGRVAGHAAAGDRQAAERAIPLRRREQSFADALERTFALRDELRRLPDDATLVCRCEDVEYGVIRRSADARDAKLQTRCGMGPCQGRVCGPAMRYLMGWPHDRVRPPLTPIPVEAMVAIGEATGSAAGGDGAQSSSAST